MTQRWQGLKREVEVLRGQFLPAPFDPLGQYLHATRVQANTRAFLVLSHAEIEEYLEASAKHLAQTCERIWSRTQRVAKPMAFLLATIGESVPAGEVMKPGKNVTTCDQRFADVVTKMFPAYYKRLRDNNGLKEQNFIDLFDPLGIPTSVLTPTLLPRLNDLGKKRGEHAHHSRKAVQSVLDPETEYKRIGEIVSDLQGFDAWISGYHEKIR